LQLNENGRKDLVNAFAKEVKANYTLHLGNWQVLEGGWQNYALGTIAEMYKLKMFAEAQ